jgi:dCMP deaminase
VVHAEVNAIVNKNAMNIRGSCMYVALFPCNDCAKIIIQSGISEVVYMSDKYHDDYHVVASRRMLEVSGVKLRQYTPTKTSITVDFTSIEKNR